MGGQPAAANPAHPAACLTGGGEMGARMRAFDWTTTPLGPVHAWSQSLKTAVGIMTNSRYPMFVWWGPQLTNLYNDAYIPMLGARHPAALGRPAATIWADIWDIVGPQAEIVLGEGRATWNEEVLLLMERNHFIEETYFTWSYSPIAGDDGAISGVFCAVTEDTLRVLSQRRLKTLRDLGERALGESRSVEQACRAAAEALADNNKDLPFFLVYLLDTDGTGATLREAVGIGAESRVAPASIAIGSASDIWHFGRVVGTRQPHSVENLEETFGRVPAGAWSEDWTRRAVVVPLVTPQDSPAGVLVAGISPRLSFDDEYRGFVELVARHLTMTIANARAYEDERTRADALADIDRTKTAFFSNVSHEFRTPLTLMLGPIEDLRTRADTELSPAAARELDIVHRSSLRLLKLVNTLLDFSRIEANRLQATFAPTLLGTYTGDLASAFRSACERAGLTLTVDCPELPTPVYVDLEMWEKIVLNLTGNAFKYTLNGEIRVSLRAAEGSVHLRVADTGTGIPADALPHLFERFYRVPNAGGRTHEGTGIGLALVQELVSLHRGTIAVESIVGEGTTFTVAIPMGKEHLSAEPIVVSKTLTSTALSAAPYLEEALRWLDDEDEPEQQQQSDAPPGTRPRILVADDNADMREYLRRLLAGRFDVEVVADGAEALRAARTHPPDLVLTDVMMPGIDGFAVVRALRSNPDTAPIPVILLSARAGEESRVGGIESGADDYLVKPFSSRELLARVTTHLELSRLRKTIFEQERSALAAVEAGEQERRRISRELHDEMGQQLAALTLGLKAVQATVPKNSAAHDGLQRLQALAVHAGREMHRIALELRPAALDQQGLQAGLASYVEDWARRSEVRVDLQSAGLEAHRLRPHVETIVYRIVQEALMNVHKHAKATVVSVVLQRHTHDLVVIVEDNGVGFDVEGAQQRGRLGLLGMKERVTLVGGTCHVESQPGRTSVFVRVPAGLSTDNSDG